MTERLEFTVDVNDETVGRQLTVYIRTPTILADYPDCWTCFVGWTGALAQERPVFGASVLQALSLAVPVLETLLRLSYPNAEFLVDGRPLLLP